MRYIDILYTTMIESIGINYFTPSVCVCHPTIPLLDMFEPWVYSLCWYKTWLSGDFFKKLTLTLNLKEKVFLKYSIGDKFEHKLKTLLKDAGCTNDFF